MAERTHARNLELIDRMTDDDLIDVATTCSNRGVALAAEMHLRRRYPSRIKVNAKVKREAARDMKADMYGEDGNG